MFNRYKVFIAYLVAVPLALLLGVMASSPDELTFVLLAVLLFCLAVPVFIGRHHALLVLFWNSAFLAAFLPGQPQFWLFFAALSFGISALNYIMGRKPFLSVPEMTRPVLFLATVVLGTAFYRGGIGMKALGGSSFGGKYYVYVLGAIFGYFALTAAQIPAAKGRKMAGLFFLSGISYALSNVVYSLGTSFFFLYYFVPSTFASDQAANDFGFVTTDRFQGVAPAAAGLLCFLLAICGIRGLFDLTKPWRIIFFFVAIVGSLFAGFRSAVILLFLIVLFQFYYERLWRTRLLPVFVGVAILVFGGFIVFANKLPLAAQRAMSFLPVAVDSDVRAEAEGSTDWRVQMWTVVLKEVPKYLWVGKGYVIDPTELNATEEASRIGWVSSPYAQAMLAGDYHNGPLSVVVPFGIAGTIAFIWLIVSGFQVLRSNYRHGDERLRMVNTLLLSFYMANLVSFIFIFGAFNSQLSIFLGTVGLSVSLNGGVRKKLKFVVERRPEHLPQPVAVEVR